MRLCDDETGHLRLFFAVLPTFIGALPPPPSFSPAGGSRRRETLKNAITLLRFETREMQHVLAADRMSYDLSVDEFEEALEALEDILFVLEDLVNIPVPENEPHLFPQQRSRWISFGDAAAHFRRTYSEAQRFNEIMRGIFDARMADTESQVKQPFYQCEEYNSSDDKLAMSELADAKRVSDTTNILLKSLTEETKACQVPHRAHIHLSGFSQPEIDMLMSVCGCNSTGKWHHVSWSCRNHKTSKGFRAPTESICSTLARSWKFKKRLRLQVGHDGTWNCTESSAEDRMKGKIKVPTLKLEELLHTKQETNTSIIRLLKRDKLQLANTVTKSLLCLLGSPLLTDGWRTETIYIAQVLDPLKGVYANNQPYILREITEKMLEYEGAGSESVLHLGVLLWELLFGRRITIIPEDEEDDDEDQNMSLFNALSREEMHSRESCIEKPFLDIIANCLNIYPETELDDQELRSKVYWSILRPLKSYVESYQSELQPKIDDQRAFSPSFHDVLKDKAGQKHSMAFPPFERSEKPSLCAFTHQKVQYSYKELSNHKDTHDIDQPFNLPSLSYESGDNLLYNGFTASLAHPIQTRPSEGNSTPPLGPDDYRIGIVCALYKELLAVRALFDERHQTPKITFEDTNEYALGRLAHHNVVAACLPSGDYGTIPAAQVITHMRRTFPSIRYYLVVGIGGGVPSKQNDICLGDVVVSHPTGGYPGVIQYDRGKDHENDDFERTGSLPPPPRALLNAISHLRADPDLPPAPLQPYIRAISDLRPEYNYPGKEHDPYIGHHRIRTDNNPKVHYGMIASGNQVIKNSQTREHLAQKYNVLCVEMEAAGIVNVAPCLVIRGICDYADAEKNKTWQEYASATAAAYAKLLLSYVRDQGP
ncbi:hypothetical protein FE257_011045 [Aspergillus nanangensis]|uniref:Nucleoside phosphorylase domain-containing protein n=1 Tax=Aspergillus nanangensis TaxID=2582783 RepID=A0AAD4GSW0_ASPNN|nr:hypothetical protein FE257_011045 [Aspergillus nanangensis]